MANLNMDRARHLAVVLVALSCCMDAVTAAPRDDLLAQLNQLIDADSLPGASVAFVDGDGVTYEHLGSDGLNERTLFEIGSVSKVFTALLAQRLVDQGKLNWSDTLAQRSGDGFTYKSQEVANIRLAELASHTSGLPRLPPVFLPADWEDPYADFRLRTLRAFFASFNPADLTKAYAYSNLGFGVLGHVAGDATGSSYSQAVRELVLVPLGLMDTYTGIDAAPSARLAVGHSGKETVAHWRFDVLAGAGALVSSPADMAAFVRLNLEPGDHSLASALLAIRKPRAPAQETGGEIAYGWHVNSSASSREPIYWHAGGTGGFRSVIAFRPDVRRGIVVLANGDTELSALAVAYLLDPAAQREEMSLDADVLPDYPGRYALTPDFIIAVTLRGGQLYAQATGQGENPIYPSGPDEFFLKVVDAQLTFSRDEAGVVSAMTLFQNGQEIRGERLAADAVPMGARFEEANVSPEKLKDYEGEYELAGKTMTVQVVRDVLNVRISGQPRLPVFPYEADKFFYRVVEAQLHFQRDDEGTVDVVVLYQNGMALPAPRKKPR